MYLGDYNLGAWTAAQIAAWNKRPAPVPTTKSRPTTQWEKDWWNKISAVEQNKIKALQRTATANQLPRYLMHHQISEWYRSTPLQQTAWMKRLATPGQLAIRKQKVANSIKAIAAAKAAGPVKTIFSEPLNPFAPKAGAKSWADATPAQRREMAMGGLSRIGTMWSGTRPHVVALSPSQALTWLEKEINDIPKYEYINLNSVDTKKGVTIYPTDKMFLDNLTYLQKRLPIPNRAKLKDLFRVRSTLAGKGTTRISGYTWRYPSTIEVAGWPGKDMRTPTAPRKWNNLELARLKSLTPLLKQKLGERRIHFELRRRAMFARDWGLLYGLSPWIDKYGKVPGAPKWWGYAPHPRSIGIPFSVFSFEYDKAGKRIYKPFSQKEIAFYHKNLIPSELGWTCRPSEYEAGTRYYINDQKSRVSQWSRLDARHVTPGLAPWLYCKVPHSIKRREKIKTIATGVALIGSVFAAAYLGPVIGTQMKAAGAKLGADFAAATALGKVKLAVQLANNVATVANMAGASIPTIPIDVTSATFKKVVVDYAVNTVLEKGLEKVGTRMVEKEVHKMEREIAAEVAALQEQYAADRADDLAKGIPPAKVEPNPNLLPILRQKQAQEIEQKNNWSAALAIGIPAALVLAG